ncbi:MAG: zf-HC2 domain-containing protein [Nevskiales bacterium]
MSPDNNAPPRASAISMSRLPGMLSCAQFDAFICDYRDGKLPLWQRFKFRLHLGLCKHCRHFLAAYESSIELQQRVLKAPDGAVPTEVPEGLVQAILKARQAQADE